jgi:hypothetical protein
MNLPELLRRWCPPIVPRTGLLGVVLGFGLLTLLGRQAARENQHRDFVRFTPWTAPDTKYYPTVNEMRAIVRAQVKPGQVLVIVGGDSVLLGVGQPPAQLWSKRLQDELGAGYCVVNLAFRAAMPTDAGAVVAESLRGEFPRQIYVANAAPTQDISPAGSLTYRFLLWEARYKGLLLDDPVRDRAIAVRGTDRDYAAGLTELKLRSALDGLFYFQDLWNDVAYTRASTVWDSYFPGTRGFSAPLQFAEPRRNFPDPEPDYLTVTSARRFPVERREIELRTIRTYSAPAYETEKAPDGTWRPSAAFWQKFQAGVSEAFPRELKARTLIVTGHAAPNLRQQLPPDEQERDRLVYAQAVAEWEKDGYGALEYGRDFTIDDYGDRTHLTWRGGEKLARQVATKVRAMSTQLGYLKP